ncbi:2-hydroxyacyl-CoA dehydratase subunit D [Haloimpatiens lingqiaonensis]|uniref:2-hydroxyacyl-CoA dehydratase subunit D n=1 Tax=Haloimpatiens lingqiaonensis TaxID=1380675 RepID=UPI0010FDBD26|nr:2-hydroxyacyl-CoA dehydratase family protein [Haloimpatiens lingqiaonensis]
MDIINSYGSIIKKNIPNNPNTTLNLIKLGLALEEKRNHLFPDKKLPPSLQYLNTICVKYILEPLKNPNNSAFVNLFAPTELLQAMEVYPLFVEAFSSFLSGLQCEDAFINIEENSGLGETLCSYHKAFLGAIESGVLPKPLFSTASSIICDANINTFRYAASKYNIPFYSVDIPYEYSKDAEIYVVEQLQELIEFMEDILGKPFSYESLKKVIHRENKSKKLLKEYYKELKYKYFPNTLTIEMYKLFASHVSIGREETLKFYEMLLKDIQKAPVCSKSTKRILWVHLLPFYHKTLRECFNFSNDYQILTCDLNFDYMEEMDISNPLASLSKKMIYNQYNGTFQRKIDNILEMYESLNADGVINFCQWGCKQSSGGVQLLKNSLVEKNIPFISLDGDGVDRRNSSSGQIKTRLEAFLEMWQNF